MEAKVHLGPAPLEGEQRGYRASGAWYLVARVGGTLSCIDDWCNHAGCLLSEGRLEGEVIVCPCHDGRFRVTDGANVTEVPLCGDQASFEVVEEDGEVYLVRGEP